MEEAELMAKTNSDYEKATGKSMADAFDEKLN
jgi:hypothetical protein